VAIFVFLMLRLTPGDPAAVIAGDNATSDQIADIRTKLGLDEPIYAQFGIWIGNVLQGNFGESFFFKKTVAELIAQRIEPTLALAICTLIIPIALAVPLGVIAAYRHGTWIDRLVMGFSVLGFSVPTFVIGYVLIYIFAIDLGWLPVQGYIRIGVDFWGFLERMVLPSFTLGIIFIALIARITRASVLEVLNEDYIRTARAKGLSELRVIGRHGLRAALTPLVTMAGLDIGLLLGGAVLTETVFNIPGVGRFAYDAIINSDLPAIQGTVLFGAFFIIVANLVVDVLYAFLDPRVRYG
jgi:peptide/nickel transport system permease protein